MSAPFIGWISDRTVSSNSLLYWLYFFVLYYTILHCILYYIILYYITLPYFTLPYLTLPYLTLPYLTLPYLTLPYFTLPHLTLPYITLHYIICYVMLCYVILCYSIPSVIHILFFSQGKTCAIMVVGAVMVTIGYLLLGPAPFLTFLPKRYEPNIRKITVLWYCFSRSVIAPILA